MFFFTPPYEMTVATSVGTDFLNIVKEEFPADHPYHHIFNEHTVKFSYSVMPNLKKKINNHNVKIAKKAEDTKKNNIQNDPKEDDYDPEEQIDHELAEVIPDDDPVVEDPGVPSQPTSTEPVTLNAKACDECDNDCGGLIVDPVPPLQTHPPPTQGPRNR